MTKGALREALIKRPMAKRVERHIALVTCTNTKERVARGRIRVRERLAVLVARLEAKSVRKSATDLDDAGVKPALLAVVKEITAAVYARTVINEIEWPGRSECATR